MIPLAPGVRVWLATGRTDMRRGFDGLALAVQETLKQDPHCGHLFVFRGRRGDLIKILGTTVRACACSRSASSAVASSGHRWVPAKTVW
jgi:transposase